MLLGSNVQFEFGCEITFESHGKREEEGESGIGSLASPREIPGSVLFFLSMQALDSSSQSTRFEL